MKLVEIWSCSGSKLGSEKYLLIWAEYKFIARFKFHLHIQINTQPPHQKTETRREGKKLINEKAETNCEKNS